MVKSFSLAAVATLMISAATSLPAQVDTVGSELASHLAKAQGYLREGKPQLAIPELKAAAALDAGNVEIEGNLGVLLYFQAAFAEAIAHLRIAVDKQPELSKQQGLLGIAELRVGDQQAARKDLEAAVPKLTDVKFKIQAGLELAGFYTRTNELDLAAATVAELRKADPANAEVLYAAYRTNSDLASESMLALALAAPESAQMHQVLAEEESRQGNTNGAIEQFRKAIAIDTNLAGIHFELAELLRSSQNGPAQKQAADEYRAALKSNPQDERAIRRLGELEAERGDTKAAFAAFSKAVDLQPGDADAQLDLAKVLTDTGQRDKALAVLEHTVELEPDNPTAHFRLATLYRAKGRAEDAKRETDLYTHYKILKDKLRATYKELLRKPDEIQTDESHAP